MSETISVSEKFKSGFRGMLIKPGEPGYDEARSVWNAMIDRRPSLIARCLGVADVAMCVDFARQHGLTLCVKGGGHNISGLAVRDGGLMLDMSLMRGVVTDRHPRQTDRCPVCVFFGTGRRRGCKGGTDQGLPLSGRRCSPTAILRVATEHSRCNPAKGPAVLLEI